MSLRREVDETLQCSSIWECVTFCVTLIVTYQFTLKYCFHVAVNFSLLQIESNMNKLIRDTGSRLKIRRSWVYKTDSKRFQTVNRIFSFFDCFTDPVIPISNISKGSMPEIGLGFTSSWSSGNPNQHWLFLMETNQRTALEWFSIWALKVQSLY